MADFIPAYHHILLNEGGYVNDPDDPGGETYKGVARASWPKWLGWHIIDLLKKQPNFPANLDTNLELREEIGAFYLANFWNKLKCEEIREQAVAESILDFGVNAGVATSAALAQKVVGTTPDGVIGPATIAAINKFNPDHFIAAFAVEKIRRYLAIVKKRPTSKKYFQGWVERAVR